MELFYSLLYQNIVKITKLSEELVKICNFQKKDFLSFKLYFFLCCCNFAKFSDSFCSVVCWDVVLEMWKQSFTDAFQNKCSSKFRKFHMKAPVMESFLIKLQAPATLLKRDSNTGVYRPGWKLGNYGNHENHEKKQSNKVTALSTTKK